MLDNPNITWGVFCKNRKKFENISGLSRNPNITWRIVKGGYKRGWDWEDLSCNLFTKYNSGSEQLLRLKD